VASKRSQRWGLTGGIGSGKTTVAQLLGRQGATVIDADAISRAVTGKNGAAIEALKARFGNSVISDDGALNRDAMRARIFSNPIAKQQLEHIVHPLVQHGIETQAELAQASGVRCIVLDIPLLVESAHWRSALDRILVIDCTEDTQVHRVMTRSGLAETEIRKIICAQAPRTTRLNAADLVLFNDAISLAELVARVGEIGKQFGL
jgi:dephospho-CoA kinase